MRAIAAKFQPPSPRRGEDVVRSRRAPAAFQGASCGVSAPLRYCAPTCLHSVTLSAIRWPSIALAAVALEWMRV
jgi:hypothetical protein